MLPLSRVKATVALLRSLRRFLCEILKTALQRHLIISLLIQTIEAANQEGHPSLNPTPQRQKTTLTVPSLLLSTTPQLRPPTHHPPHRISAPMAATQSDLQNLKHRSLLLIPSLSHLPAAKLHQLPALLRKEVPLGRTAPKNQTLPAHPLQKHDRQQPPHHHGTHRTGNLERTQPPPQPRRLPTQKSRRVRPQSLRSAQTHDPHQTIRSRSLLRAGHSATLQQQSRRLRRTSVDARVAQLPPTPCKILLRLTQIPQHYDHQVVQIPTQQHSHSIFLQTRLESSRL